MTPYPPGKPIDELEREYGISNSIKLASNENPWGPSPEVIRALQDELTNLHRYPDGSSHYLVEAICAKFKVEPEEVVAGNGSNEVIEFLVKAFVREGDEVITSHPSFLMYQKFVQVRGGVNHVIDLHHMNHDLDAILRAVSPRTRLIFIDNPNNPTGTVIEPVVFHSFLKKVPESVIVVLDEAYVDFMNSDSRMDIHTLLGRSDGRCPVVLLRTFSKAYGLSGLRVGFGLMDREIGSCLHKVRQPFNVNLLAQAGARAALEDEEYFQQILTRTRRGLNFLTKGVEVLGCTGYPSQTNFFLVDVGCSGDRLYRAMLYKGVIVRSMSSYGFADFIRVTVGTDEENSRFLVSLKECLSK